VAGRTRRAGAAAGAVVAGDFEVDALLDAGGSFTTYPEAFPDTTDGEWTPWRERHPELFDGDRWQVPFRSFLIRGRGRTILVDTGVGPPGEGEFLPGRQGWLPGELERLGAPPDLVFLTHVHVDHVGWNAAFDGVPFVTHRRSIDLSEERGRPLPAGATAVEGETELAPGVIAFETPGHLPGHMSVLVGDELVILGDVAVHPAQLTRPGLVYASDHDAERSAKTRAEVLTRYGDRILACGHFPGSSFGRVLDGLWTAL
jgi:glyoxylase-like metal-dependent hydrolase (beta-lactamase superfamily II)